MSTGSNSASSIASSYEQSKSAKAALKSQETSSLMSSIITKQMYDQAQGYLSPYRELGSSALGEVESLMGYKGAEARTSALSRFREDPGYKWQTQQGEEGLTRSAMAGGDLFSGNFAKRMTDYRMGRADQSYSTYFNRLMGQVGIGQNAAAGLASQSTQFGNTMSNIYTNQGQNRANYYTNVGALKGKAITDVGADIQSGTDTAVNTVSSIYGGGMFGG